MGRYSKVEFGPETQSILEDAAQYFIDCADRCSEQIGETEDRGDSYLPKHLLDIAVLKMKRDVYIEARQEMHRQQERRQAQQASAPGEK